ncbi:MAG: response regulator [Coriobacteriales bacterium]|nr:response regulator [Coriobacteriales bacterium]
MSMKFAETLKKLRAERGLSQRELADQLYVSRPAIARWESGNRLPDVTIISRLAQCLHADVGMLLSAMEESDESPNVIMVDDRKITLAGGLPVLEAVMPDATVVGFTRPSEAVAYAKANRVALAFLDIELGNQSGLDLCRTLLEINPRTNVIYLTAHGDYSLDAWGTGASGFMLKPITPEGVQAQLKNLRHPFAF